jgi:hypothetical protein
MAERVEIGTIKLIDTANGGGVIAPERISSQAGGDRYFKVVGEGPFRVGQLVQYVVDETGADPQAEQVEVLRPPTAPER